MKIYIDNSSHARRVGRHMVRVNPGNHLSGTECPGDWFSADGSPKEFELEFKYGCFDCEQGNIPDSVIKYVLDQGIAQKHKPSEIIRPEAM